MDNASVDLIVTDPPYLMKYKTGRRKDKTHKFTTEIIGDDDKDLIHNYIQECYRILKDNSACYIFCNQNKVDVFKTELEQAGFIVKILLFGLKIIIQLVIWLHNMAKNMNLFFMQIKVVALLMASELMMCGIFQKYHLKTNFIKTKNHLI